MRRRWRDSWPAVAVVACIAVVVVLCLLASTTSGAVTARRDVRGRGFAAGRVLLRHGVVDRVQPEAGSLYVALEQGPRGQDLLERLDPGNGRVLARRALGGRYDGSVVVDGSLWAVTTSYTRTSSTSAVWRLDPGTLAFRSHLILPGSVGALNVDQPLAIVGPRLWLAYAGRLVQIDPETGTLGTARRVARASELGIIAGPRGRVLVLSAGDGSGRGWIQTRDATTGAFIATTHNYLGVTSPRLGGTSAGRLWISEATGMMGFAQAVSLRTLRPLRTPAVPRFTTNGIEARVAGGTLIVSQGAGGASSNYCGSPVTGAARLALPAGARRGSVLAATATRIYYLAPPRTGDVGGPLLAAPIPAACR